MLAADADLQTRLGAPALVGADPHQPPDTNPVVANLVNRFMIGSSRSPRSGAARCRRQ